MRARDRYMVIALNGEKHNIKKFIVSQLRSVVYSVGRSDCMKAQSNNMSRIFCRKSKSESSSCDSIECPSLFARGSGHPIDTM